MENKVKGKHYWCKDIKKATTPTKGGTTKGFMISGKFGIVVECGYAVFSCPFAAGGSNSPMQFHTMRMRWTL